MSEQAELSDAQKRTLETFMECGSTSGTATKLGLSRSTVRSYLRRVEDKGMAPWLEKMPVPDHLQMRNTTVHIKEGQVVEEWRRLIPGQQEIMELIEELAEPVRGRGRAAARRVRKSDTDRQLFEIDIYDPHVGMYASARETGDEDYDTDLAVKRMLAAVEDLASRADRPHTVVLVFGGDIMHADNRSNMTEKSHNILDTDTRYFRTIDYVSKVCIDCVQIAASLAQELKVVVVPGNHDFHSCLWLHRLLTLYYEKCPNIEILQQDTFRKHMVWGNNLLAWAHGDNIATTKWPLVVAAEWPEAWGRTVHRHLKLGHVHHKKALAPVTVNEQPGLLVEYLEALCPSDAWHSGSGYVGSARGASAFTYDREHGLYTRHYHHPERTR
jgi:DNA-binding MarR family transcriptional regulator